MLKDSPLNRFLIRLAILALRSVAPLAITYTIFRIYHQFVAHQAHTPTHQWTRPWVWAYTATDSYLLAEAAFYLLFALPRSYYLDRSPAPYMPLPSREARRDILQRTWDATPDAWRYLSMYFYGTPVEELHAGDVEAWLVWRLWSRMDTMKGVDAAELDEYMAYTEEVLGYRFRAGKLGTKFMAVTHEPMRFVHRPLVWYVLFIGGADTVACVGLLRMGMRFYASSRWCAVSSFPFRPVALLSGRRRKSPSKEFTYWLLPHTSRSAKHHPIVFIHGVGVGLHFYLTFLHELLPHCRKYGIGVLCLEVNQVCSRISSPLPPPEVISREVLRILDQHEGFRSRKVLLVTHSYGSAIAANFLNDAVARERIGPLVFADPVCFSFHPPDVAYNFLRRSPKSASEWQLWFFACMDGDVQWCMTKGFRWKECGLWREDVQPVIANGKRRMGEDRRVTVFLAGRDIITDVETTGAYLTRERVESKWYRETAMSRMDRKWKDQEWQGKKEDGLKVIYMPGLNHAEIFEEDRERALLVKAVQAYSVEDLVQAKSQGNK